MQQSSHIKGGGATALKMINSIVNAMIGGNTDEAHLSELVLGLQVKQLELNAKLESATHDACNAMPLIMRELERIREDADDLRSKLVSIEISLGAVEASTEKSVALLAELDRVKKNLEACALILKEADAFLALSKRLESAHLQDFQVCVVCCVLCAVYVVCYVV
jgi:hypothetical protein